MYTKHERNYFEITMANIVFVLGAKYYNISEP